MYIEPSKRKMILYILNHFKLWYQQQKANTDNDLSVLKTLKLIFFLSTIEIKGKYLLDKGFQFAALPYGHVELQVYNYFASEEGQKLINKRSLDFSTLPNIVDIDIDADDKLFIDECIALLQTKNKELINYSPFELVELSHKYSSWIINFGIAQQQCTNRRDILMDEIKKEDKFYTL